MPEKNALSLTGLSAALKNQKRHLRFVDAADRWHAAMSISKDLESAYHANLLMLGIDVQQSPMREEIGRALQTHAIIMYCRAVVSDSNGRIRLDVRKAFDADLKQKHEQIRDLRNQCIAHLGISKEDLGRIWTREIGTLTFLTGQTAEISFFNSRANFSGLVTADLKSLLNKAIPFVEDEVLRREELMKKFLPAVLNDDSLSSLVAFHRSRSKRELASEITPDLRGHSPSIHVTADESNFIKSVFPNYE